MDVDALRERMIERQLKPRGVVDPGVLEAMRRVPRHLFVPDHAQEAAYDDGPLLIGEGQTISQPFMVAFMTQCLRLTGDERVLEIIVVVVEIVERGVELQKVRRRGGWRGRHVHWREHR